MVLFIILIHSPRAMQIAKPSAAETLSTVHRCIRCREMTCKMKTYSHPNVQNGNVDLLNMHDVIMTMFRMWCCKSSTPGRVRRDRCKNNALFLRRAIEKSSSSAVCCANTYKMLSTESGTGDNIQRGQSFWLSFGRNCFLNGANEGEGK